MKEFGGPDKCAIGFALGMERLLSLVPVIKEEENFVYLAFLGQEAQRQGMALARFLRREGIECLMEYKKRSIRSQMGRANKLGASWVLIVGEEELEKGKYQLKNMATGKQRGVSREEITNIIRKESLSSR